MSLLGRSLLPPHPSAAVGLCSLHPRVFATIRHQRPALQGKTLRFASHKRHATNRDSRETRQSPKMPRLEAMELDNDLQEVLELATDEELEQLYTGLFGNSLLSPLGKSLQSAEPATVHYHGREALARRIEHRFRFLAADAVATLRGKWPTYRDALLSIHDRLRVPCPRNLATNDLEAEIFLFLLQEHGDVVDAAMDATSSRSAAATANHADEGDGMAQPPAAGRRPNIIQKVLAPLRLGAKEVLPTLTKLSASVAVTNLHVTLAQRLGTALATRSVQYEVALQLALSAGGRGIAAGMQGRIAVQAAQRGVTAAATKYAAARSVLSFLGPVMWTATVIDLARMSIGTDYARVVRAVFIIAQIRLLRRKGWDLPIDIDIE